MADGAERFVEVADGARLWVQTAGDPEREPLLLVMGANASGLGWPDGFVELLAEHHHVVRYDHRDTGRSTHAFDERPYPLRTLATDVVAVLDALHLDRAHVVGMSMGATLAQVLLVDRPERFLSAVLVGTAALDDADAPGPSETLLRLWSELGDERDAASERAWQLRHWQALHGGVLPFDEEEYDALERRVRTHRGSAAAATAHALAAQDGLERDLSRVTTPTLVVEAPEDPVAPPPTARRLAARIPAATMVTVPGMGHSLPRAVHRPLAAAVLEHTRRSSPRR